MALTIPNTGGYQYSLTFIGQANELTSDSDNHDLILHDGVTPGGFRIPNRDNLDGRYQAQNAELDGFVFDPSVKGIMIRVGVGSYRIGSLTVNGANLAITQADGVAGDPQISLKPEISSDHSATGNWDFQLPIQADGGLVGTTTGQHNGDVTGDVTGDVLGNLAGNVVGTFTGDVDVRDSEFLVDPGQIPQAAVAGLVAALTALVIPTGAVMLWAGSAAAIPAGWALCDGTGGTPNLVNKFIRGANAGSQGATGGSDTHNHTITADAAGTHTHTATVAGHALTLAQIPAHSHSIAMGIAEGDVTTNATNGGVTAAPNLSTNSQGDGQQHTHGITVDTDGSHTHAISPSAADNVPAYYSLCYIIKL